MADAPGYYALPIIPSFEGLDGKINSQMSKAFGSIGKRAGGSMSDGIVDGAKVAERAVEKLAATVEKAQDKQANAADKTRVAEEKLTEAREKGLTGSRLSAMVAARDRAARAEIASNRDLERSAEQLADARRRADNAGSGDSVGSAGGRFAGIRAGLEGALKGAGEGASAAGESAGGDFAAGFAGRAAAIGARGGPVGIAIGGLAILGVGVGKALWDQIQAGFDQKTGENFVQAGLGIDNATMANLAKSAGSAYANNFGESYQENLAAGQSAVKSGLIDSLADPASTQKAIEGLTTISSLMGTEIPEVSRAAGQLIRTGFAKDSGEAFDIITKGFQNGLDNSGDWLDTINEYSTQFRKLGLTGADSMGLLSQMVKNGARDTDVAADALKEFSIRAVDGSTASATAFANAGLDAVKMTEKFAQGGGTARAAFQETVNAINKIPDPVLRAQTQVGLFGTQAEDLGNAVNSIDLDGAAAQFGNLAGATEDAANKMSEGPMAKLEQFRRGVEVSWNGVQTQLASFAAPGLMALGDWLAAHQDDVVDFFTSLAQGATLAGGVVLQFGATTTRAIAGVVNAVGDMTGGIERGMAAFARFTGDTKKADELDAAADSAFGWADGLYATADGLDKAAAGVREFGFGLDETVEQSREATKFTDALGKTVASLPDGKTITLSDNSPETIEHLKALGIAVETTPNGINVTATTDEAKRILDAFRASQANQAISPPLDPNMDPLKRSINEVSRTPIPVTLSINTPAGTNPLLDQARNRLGLAPGQAPAPLPGFPMNPPRAAGGLFSSMPKGAMIQPAKPGLVQWAEPSTKGEAFIPLNGSARSQAVWAETGRRLGIGLDSFATGGITTGSPDVDAALGLVGTAYDQGARTDCSGMVARVINRTLGLPDDGGLMSTKTAQDWLAKRGFQPGLGGPGMVSVGWYDHGPNPNDGHMAMTLSNGLNAEAGGKNGKFTVGSGAKGAADAQFDHHMFLPQVFGEGAGSAGGGYGGSYGGAGGSLGGGGGGGFTVDAGKVADAQANVAKADADVAVSEARIRELKADAKESERLSAQAALDKDKADAARARRELAEAQQGKPNKASGGGGSSGGDPKDLVSILGGGILETFGLDGSWLPDIKNLGIMKMFNSILGIGGGGDGSTASSGMGVDIPGAASGLPFGMIPNAATPLPDAVHQGTGMAPGPGGGNVSVTQNIDQSNTIQPGDNMSQMERMLNRTNQDRPRVATYTPPGFS